MTLALVCLLSAAHPPLVQKGCACTVTIPTPGGWCVQCKKGYVAGRPAACPELIEAIDTHGHPVTRDGFDCLQCRKAFDRQALCPSCGWGFVGTRLYFTPLTWALARGTHHDPDRLTCAACRKLAHTGGWCATCQRGRVGDFYWTERAIYEVAHRDYPRLLEALETCTRCDGCATAQFFKSRCIRCRKSYKTADSEKPSPPGATAPPRE